MNKYDGQTAIYKYKKHKSDYLHLLLIKNTQHGGKKYGTYADSNKIYSVNLMFCYIDKYNPQILSISTKKLFEQLEYPSWGDISPIEVVKDMNNKKYIDHKTRILNADLKYPIMIEKKTNIIIDGLHRLAKAYLLKKRKIHAYIFDENEMNKFVLTHKKRNNGNWKKSDWEYYDSLSDNDLKILCEERL